MSGFGQNPTGSSAFSFPSLKQPTATTAPTMTTGFTFGAPNTTAVAANLGGTPAFGPTPTLGMKTNITMTPTSTPGTLPALGAPQAGPLFGTAWPGVFSPGNTSEVSSTTAAVTSIATAAAAAPKPNQFTFGATVAATAPQGEPQTSASFTIPYTSAPVKAPPALQPTVTSAPTLNFSFGSTPAPNTTASTVAPSLGLNLPTFGGTPTSKPSQPTTAVVSTTLATPPSTTLKFSVSSSVPLTSVTKTTTMATNLTMFSTPAAAAAATSAPATTALPPPAVSVATPASTVSAVTVPTTTTVTPSVAATGATPSEEDLMTYSKLQENINKWAMELEKQEKIFLHQATEMNGWDRVIVENSDKLHMLNAKIEKVRKEQRHLDLELDYILSQQNELDYILKGLEKEWGSVPPSDPERQHTYKIAESLDYKLKLMSEDLKEVVDHMNAMNYPPNDEFNPVMQIVRILNAHMNVLLMVERKTNLADCKVKEVGKLLELCKRDYDRACHLYFD